MTSSAVAATLPSARTARAPVGATSISTTWARVRKGYAAPPRAPAASATRISPSVAIAPTPRRRGGLAAGAGSSSHGRPCRLITLGKAASPGSAARHAGAGAGSWSVTGQSFHDVPDADVLVAIGLDDRVIDLPHGMPRVRFQDVHGVLADLQDRGPRKGSRVEVSLALLDHHVPVRVLQPQHQPAVAVRERGPCDAHRP